MARRSQDVTMEGVRLAILNFSGVEKQYNPKGKRNFLAMLDRETADAMAADGWNVKELKAREEGDEPAPFLKINVNYENDPAPRIILITSAGQTDLTEDTVGMLDTSEIINADLLVSPYHYEVRGEAGVSAYLRKAYITIQEDALDLKYASVPRGGTTRAVTEDTPF
jgi:hypothetical protein